MLLHSPFTPAVGHSLIRTASPSETSSLDAASGCGSEHMSELKQTMQATQHR